MTTRGARFGAVCAVAALTVGLGGCKPGTFLKVHQNVTEMENTVFLTGDVTHSHGTGKSIVVFALQEKKDGPLAYNYAHLAGPTRFVLRLEPDRTYTVGAFADLNDNLRPDAGEDFGLYPQPFEANAKNHIPRIALTVEPGGSIPARIADALDGLAGVEQKALPIIVGEQATLDDKRFTMEVGTMGLWAPFDYAVQVGTGVYFLQPYDPDKIPIVFVAGAGGYPKQWAVLIDQLDKSKYQPWVYAYPSGMRLEEAARVLNGVIEELHKRHKFQRLYVTAHSMGGLVSRGFIQRNVLQDRNDYVKLFVTMSTPWSGHAAAWMGVELSPATIPSWIDMQTNSEYQQAIFAEPLADDVWHYLFFAHLEPDYKAEDADDGTVSVVSQLRPEAVREAKEVRGFLGEHDSPLSSRESLEAYDRILQEADRRK